VQKRSLSLCLLARNDEATIGRAIKSALAVADEVVVVDTGSADNTRLIVEGYGARVIDFAWRDDFSAARNAGLSAAYGDWILVLDADEVLEPVRPVELARLLANEAALAYYARVRREGPHGQLSVQDRVRLFRNLPEIRFRYPVHEDLLPSLLQVASATAGRVLQSSLAIVHGQERDPDRQERKSRNLRLLRKALAADASDPYLHYLLGCELSVYHEDELLPVRGFAQALAALQAAVGLVRGAKEDAGAARFGADLYARLAHALLAADKPQDAMAVAEEGIGHFGEGSLLRLSHAVALLRASLRQGGESAALRARAVQKLSALMEGPARLEPAPISPRHFSLYPLRYLGLAALADGRPKESRRWFMQALEQDRTYAAAWCGLARLAELSGATREALQLYLKALKIDGAETSAWLGGSVVLARLGFRDNATSWLDRIYNQLPEHPRLPELIRQMGTGEYELVESF
jgi:tetratricopeptide (TPR) repeat protein